MIEFKYDDINIRKYNIIAKSTNFYDVYNHSGKLLLIKEIKNDRPENEQTYIGSDDTFYSYNKPGRLLFYSNKKYGYLDTLGNEITPQIYDDLKPFGDGLAAFKLNNKYGYIDFNGKIVIPNKYDEASEFKFGLAVVKINNRVAVIDRENHIIVPFSSLNEAVIYKDFIVMYESILHGFILNYSFLILTHRNQLITNWKDEFEGLSPSSIEHDYIDMYNFTGFMKGDVLKNTGFCIDSKGFIYAGIIIKD